MATTPINLRERFGRWYRVAYEESYQASYGQGAAREDPWLMILLCRYGHLYPFGGNNLAASVDGHPNVAGQLRRPRWNSGTWWRSGASASCGARSPRRAP